MCGRYACSIQSLGRWRTVFKVWLEELNDRYNIAPTATVAAYTRQGWQAMRWGLIPSWSKETATKYATFNARAETLTVKAAFRHAWQAGQRCLIPASGYFEWHGSGRDKQPYYIHACQDEPLVFAGLWDQRTDNGRNLCSCSIITCAAEGDLLRIHPRRPLLLEPEHAGPWLEAPVDRVLSLLKDPPRVTVRMHRVEKRVGNVRNQGRELITPLDGIGKDPF